MSNSAKSGVTGRWAGERKNQRVGEERMMGKEGF
jgi:hypothetical protein